MFLKKHVVGSGPSPRVWGIRKPETWIVRAFWSIPTRVGNTKPSPPRLHPTLVHPHACGEYALKRFTFGNNFGPSPRVWGILRLLDLFPSLFRSIPTRVGNTPEQFTSNPRGSVHPHACGEYLARSTQTGRWHGPSPRVWGILQHRHHFGNIRRSIPTRVGNTT